MHTRKLDLNLLQTFHAVYSAGTVSRAAERLGLSQPAVSHNLRRLRLAHQDPLFVRTQGGMAPTAKAQRLARAVEHALSTLETALRESERFDPASATRTFRLHMSDIGEAIFLPSLVRDLACVAPGLQLEAFQLDDRDILPSMESGRIDLALGYIPALTGVQQHFLLHEKYVVLMRGSHPLARAPQGRTALAKLHYVLVRSHPATGRVLKELGLHDRIRLTLPHFMVLPGILAETDLAVVMPLRLSEAFSRMGDYTVWRPRVGLPAFDVSVHWYWRYESEPGNRWLRERIIQLFSE